MCRRAICTVYVLRKTRSSFAPSAVRPREEAIDFPVVRVKPHCLRNHGREKSKNGLLRKHGYAK